MTQTSIAKTRSAIQSVGRVCAIADQYHSHIWGVWRSDWSRAVGDYEYIEPKACGHTVDLLAHRARVLVDINLGQLAAHYLLNTRVASSELPRLPFSSPITAPRWRGT